MTSALAAPTASADPSRARDALAAQVAIADADQRERRERERHQREHDQVADVDSPAQRVAGLAGPDRGQKRPDPER